MTTDIGLLDISNEKTTSKITLVDVPIIPTYDYFVRYRELKYRVVLFMFWGLATFFLGVFL